MLVKELFALLGNETRIIIELDTGVNPTVFDDKLYLLHGKYLMAEIIWIRPITNGLALKIKQA